MRNYFLLTFLSLFVIFIYSCGGDDSNNTNLQCTLDRDCAENETCNTTTNKCEIKVETDVLTSIELDIENSADAKMANLLIGEKKTVIAYGIYDNNATNAQDISKSVRWYSTNSSVGIASKSTDGQIKFEAKAVGTTEIYCKYQGLDSEKVTFIVSDAVVESINLSSNIGDSIFLHQAITWKLIATFEGGKQGNLEPNSVIFHSAPEGLIKNDEGEYRFTSIGTYDVWATKDAVDSNHLTIEVKDNVVTGIELTYDRDEGEFFVNIPHKIIVKEKYEGNGESILDNTTGLTWKVETRVDNGDGTYTPTDSVEGTDYEIDGFNITFKRPERFFTTVSKVYGDSTFSGLFGFIVIEAE